MKKTIVKTIVLSFLLLLILVAVPISASAATFIKGQSVYVGKNEVIADSLYAVGNAVTVDGTIKGDLICAGGSIIVNGKVEGDVIGVGQNITVNGEVGGNVRALSGSININGKINGNLTAAAGLINLQSDAQINKDVIIGVGNLEDRGKIGRDLIGGAGNVIIGGEIGRDVKLWLDQNVKGKSPAAFQPATPLTIAEQGKINGSLTYTATPAASIASSTSIKGEVKHNVPQVGKVNAQAATAFWGWFKIIALFSMLIIGLVLTSLWREEIKKITDLMQAKVGPTLGWGVAILFLTPIIIFVLMITMIGIPLALIIGALWLIGLCISKILVAILLGRVIIEKYWQKQKDSMFVAMVLGVIIFWILCLLPILGFAVCFFATLWGLGGLWLFFKKA